jgi:ParB family chromosome partitioning protein
LAEAVVRDKEALGRIEQTLADDKVGSSDARFKLALGAAAQPTGNRGAREEIELRTIAGNVVGKATFGTEVRLSFKPEEAAFREFLREELPALMARYSARREG